MGDLKALTQKLRPRPLKALTASATSHLRATLGHSPLMGMGACSLSLRLQGKWVSQLSWDPSSSLACVTCPTRHIREWVSTDILGASLTGRILGLEACKGTLVFLKLSRIIKHQILFHMLYAYKPFT